MAKPSVRYGKARNVFGVLFILFTGLFLVLGVVLIGWYALGGGSRPPALSPTAVDLTATPSAGPTVIPTVAALTLEPTVAGATEVPTGEAPTPVPTGEPPTPPAPAPPGTASLLSDQAAVIGTLAGAGVSCLGSITTFIGLISTVALGWRQEARAAKDADVARKKLELEIEKQRLELADLEDKRNQTRPSGREKSSR